MTMKNVNTVYSIEDIKTIFSRKLEKLSKSPNSFLIPSERYEQLIQEVEKAEKKTKKNDKDHRRLKRFNVISSGGIKRLVSPIGTNFLKSGLRYYISNDEVFDVIHAAHIQGGHCGRDKLQLALSVKYANVTNEEIKIYLKLCVPCEVERNRNRFLPKRDKFGQYLGGISPDLTGMVRMANNFEGDESFTFDDGMGIKRAASAPSVEPKKMKMEAEVPQNAGGSNWSKNDSSSRSAYMQVPDSALYTSERDHDKTVIKKEIVKEELILEDYGDFNDFTEETSPNVSEADSGLKEESVAKSTLSPGGVVGSFETVICGCNDIKIKQEVFEDESDPLRSSCEVEPTTTWVATVRDGPLPIATPHCALPTNLDSPNLLPRTISTVHSPQNQPLKGNSERAKGEISGNQLKTGKQLPWGSKRCRICDKILTSLSDLVKHCMVEHSIKENSTATTSSSSSTTISYSETLAAISSIAIRPSHWMERIHVSLRKIPVENRKSSREKIIELVQFISDKNVNPDLVTLSVMSE